MNKEKELQEKQVWQKPEILDLDLDKTTSGSIGNVAENTYSFS